MPLGDSTLAHASVHALGGLSPIARIDGETDGIQAS
jgi:hypothetical protein